MENESFSLSKSLLSHILILNGHIFKNSKQSKTNILNNFLYYQLFVIWNCYHIYVFKIIFLQPRPIRKLIYSLNSKVSAKGFLFYKMDELL